MLGVVANKQSDNAKFVYMGKWWNADRTRCCNFRFGIVADDNAEKTDYNKLSGISGQMKIKTKSTLPFEPEDVIMFRGQKYNILLVDGNRVESGEQAMSRFNVNGNVPIYLTLRKAG